jgi:hypothetical protein
VVQQRCITRLAIWFVITARNPNELS